MLYALTLRRQLNRGASFEIDVNVHAESRPAFLLYIIIYIATAPAVARRSLEGASFEIFGFLSATPRLKVDKLISKKKNPL